ncbi:MAG: hypothetical protein ACXV7G_07595 [Halobacteriota archaeon]
MVFAEQFPAKGILKIQIQTYQAKERDRGADFIIFYSEFFEIYSLRSNGWQRLIQTGTSRHSEGSGKAPAIENGRGILGGKKC